MEPLSDKQLFNQIQSGNKDCFEKLFFNYYDNLCRYAYLIIKKKHDAEEIVQETFVKLWERKSEIYIDTSIKAYLYKAVHNQCLNHIDYLRVRERFSDKYLSENKDMVSPVSPDYPLANLLSQEIDAVIQKAISNLPGQCKEVFVEIRQHDLSYAETAEKIGISINTVKTQLQRAMSKLREELKEFLP